MLGRIKTHLNVAMLAVLREDYSILRVWDLIHNTDIENQT